MKLAKISLVAAILIGTQSFAFSIENTKLNGDVKLYYGTIDSNEAAAPSMFEKESTYADMTVKLGLTTEFNDYLSAGISASFDFENKFVGMSWSNTHRVPPTTTSSSTLDDDASLWITEAWIKGSMYDTDIVLGRQFLDTPLIFSETWSVDENSFEAAYFSNNSMKDTTVIAAYIGRSNGSYDDTASSSLNSLGKSQGGIVSVDGKFHTFAESGAFTVGVLNNTYKPLTTQVWYYDFMDFANAYWLQADLEIQNIFLGAQYSALDLDSASDVDQGYSFTMGYKMNDIATFQTAYSSMDDKGGFGYLGNIATSNHQSKFYTAMWWSSGVVNRTGADSYSLSAESTVAGDVDIFLAYYFSDVDPQNTSLDNFEFREITAAVSKSFGALDTSLALIFDDIDGRNINDSKATHLQVYLKYNF